VGIGNWKVRIKNELKFEIESESGNCGKWKVEKLKIT
jgi:hypothetical protein